MRSPRGADGSNIEADDSTQGDPYARENALIRPDTTEQQRELGRSALDGAARVARSPRQSDIEPASQRVGSAGLPGAERAANVTPRRLREKVGVLGSRPLANFRAGKPNQLVGQTARSTGELAVLAQVYRDPRFGTLRVVYVDGAGKVSLISVVPFVWHQRQGHRQQCTTVAAITQ
ncbi:hypothetical protein ERD78_02945 [Allopusillimonas soli]|uniref:Uncharacterized protein n=1 Tax=Allopusillimonas soli TaxID=659016 RepID=A0A853F5L6_9BURK|nr:hypothetical protein [Allopusillimonas soli]NYT35815.1 hypothetical protein [Allopusillimonas soli]TEA76188.1 hypothetical protein ERD78_02945 [Allopusillimonas soli]